MKKNSKLKWPKKIIYSNSEIEIVRDNQDFGCHFYLSDKSHISIGTKDKSEYSHLAGLTHELAEIAAVKAGIRGAVSNENNDYVFACDHKQFNAWMEDLAMLLWQFMR